MKNIKAIPTEHEEQVSFIFWFEKHFPHDRIFAIPNGLWSKNIAAAKKAVREGLKKGVPDLFIPSMKIFIEMKRIKSGTLSAHQKDWIEYLKSIKYKVIVAKGWLDARSQILEIKKNDHNPRA